MLVSVFQVLPSLLPSHVRFPKPLDVHLTWAIWFLRYFWPSKHCSNHLSSRSFLSRDLLLVRTLVVMSKHFFVPTWLGVVCFILSISTSSLCEAKKPDGTSMTPSATASAPAQTHTVQVGLADHKFRPEVTLAEIGDVSSNSISSRQHRLGCLTPYPTSNLAHAY